MKGMLPLGSVPPDMTRRGQCTVCSGVDLTHVAVHGRG